jgi:Mor family transcriptional regulator
VADNLTPLAVLQASLETAARDAGLEASLARGAARAAVDQLRQLFGGERVYVPIADTGEREERDAHALSAHRAGASLREIGTRLCISKSEAARAIARALEREQASP